MRAVVQRVSSARVEVDEEVVGAIDHGLLAYVGFGRHDTDEDRAWGLSKIVAMRVFADEAGKMSRSVTDVGGAILLVSQFTLYGDLRRGRRPSFDDAMAPDRAERFYDAAVREARAMGVRLETGRFRADMRVFSVNEGPVTIWIDSAVRALAASETAARP
ncbi:MAG TPA: D-aminoacyl-tRNA deacylase [Polyangiaceae bacterium]|nr:D-aminoacyl-tRNA deacylase [Polyangiaceae bacterium]